MSGVFKVMQPRTRGECENGPRPCPWTRCRYHLANSATDGELANESCALDVADRGPIILEDVGTLLGGITRERVRQIEKTALEKLATRDKKHILRDYAEGIMGREVSPMGMMSEGSAGGAEKGANELDAASAWGWDRSRESNPDQVMTDLAWRAYERACGGESE